AKLTLEDMASGDCIFSATGVTGGSMLSGVRDLGDYVETETLVMHSSTATQRYLRTLHPKKA
ncbi:MAG: fructose-bisphosphatase class II, partial [Pseudomonadota bacterium]